MDRGLQKSLSMCVTLHLRMKGQTLEFFKMCRSLDAHGFNVALVVADGKPDDDRWWRKNFRIAKTLI